MKKFLSLVLALVMICSLSVVAFAETTSWNNGTDVTYTGSNTVVDEETGDETYNTPYTVTVPKLLAPGGDGEVVATGCFPSTQTLIVKCDYEVEMNHTLNGADGDDDKTLKITFNGQTSDSELITGISLVGNNEVEVTDTVEVAVEAMTDALYGQWAGHFSYDVTLG